jgi:hypothetical protein
MKVTPFLEGKETFSGAGEEDRFVILKKVQLRDPALLLGQLRPCFPA